MSTSKSSRRVTNGATVWSELRMVGTRRDGVPHEMRGVIVFDVAGELIRPSSRHQ
jgi:hypothetical protein